MSTEFMKTTPCRRTYKYRTRVIYHFVTGIRPFESTDHMYDICM